MSSTCALVPRSPPQANPHYLSGWLADTFVNSDDAEASLCADRSGFLRNDYLQLIPLDIRRHIIHPGAVANVEGFRELFNYLNTNPTANYLRQHIVNYFNEQHFLRDHLREPLSGSSFPLTHESHDSQALNLCRASTRCGTPLQEGNIG